jgi:nucleotide-binding universal stress UspA family protein
VSATSSRSAATESGVPGTVVVGYDGSDSARDALGLGEVLTEPVQADLIVARVYPWEPGEVPEERSLADLEQAARSLGGRPEVVAGDTPATGLQDLAAEVGAELLIVGSGGSDGARRTVAGHVGLRLLHGAPCPVAIALRGFARRYAPDIRIIAVGYDGSDGASTVLRNGGRLAGALGAHLRVIAVAPGEDKARATLEDRLADGLASLPPEIDSSRVLRSGEPARVLLDEAERETDLLVVGSRRHGPPRRALLGSVSAELVQQAPCAVLVTPRGTVPAARIPLG